MPTLRITSLRKGQWIPPARLEIFFNATARTSRYDAKFMILKKQIEEDSNDAGNPLLCKRENLGLKVMTDSEALVYKQKQHRRTVNKLEKVQIDLHRIDSTRLSDEEYNIYADETALQAAIISAVGAVVRKLRLKIAA